MEIVNAYCSEGHQYYDRFVYYSYAAINDKEIIKYGFQIVEKNVLADDAYMGCDGAGLLGESTGPISEQDVYAYLATIKSSNPDILIYPSRTTCALSTNIPTRMACMLRNWPPREQTNTTKTLKTFCVNPNAVIYEFAENTLKNLLICAGKQ